MSHRLTKAELNRVSVMIDRWLDGGPTPNPEAISRLLAHAIVCDDLLDRINRDLERGVPDELRARDA